MPTPVYSTGQVLAASDCNNWFLPLVAYKTSDTARASTTTPAIDPDLQVTLAANSFYNFIIYLYFEGSATASQGIKWNWAFPASATIRFHGTFADAAGGQNVGVSFTGSQTQTGGTNGAGSNRGASLNGTVFTSATSGTFGVQWAQNVSEASTVTLHAQSYMILQKMG